MARRATVGMIPLCASVDLSCVQPHNCLDNYCPQTAEEAMARAVGQAEAADDTLSVTKREQAQRFPQRARQVGWV